MSVCAELSDCDCESEVQIKYLNGILYPTQPSVIILNEDICFMGSFYVVSGGCKCFGRRKEWRGRQMV
jgi:hypothetical protein